MQVCKSLAYSKLVKFDFVQFMLYRQVSPVYFKQITFENILISMSEMEQIFPSPRKTKPCCKLMKRYIKTHIHTHTNYVCFQQYNKVKIFMGVKTMPHYLKTGSFSLNSRCSCVRLL